MTIKEEYEYMKSELRMWNNRSNWDDTKYSFKIERYTKRAKTEFVKLLNKDFVNMNFDIEHGVISTEEYNKLWKVWNDCSRSITNMNVF